MPRLPSSGVRRVVHAITIHPDVRDFLRAHPGQGSRMIEEALIEKYGIPVKAGGVKLAGGASGAVLAGESASGVAQAVQPVGATAAPPAPTEGHPLSPVAQRHYQRLGLPLPTGARVVTTAEVQQQAHAAVAETKRLICGDEEFD